MFNKTSGKVRDIYSISDKELVIVTSDRISAFDAVLPKTVPGKGKILNALSLFWFGRTSGIISNHILSGDTKDMPGYFQESQYEGRTVLVKKLKMLPFECIVRGYMFGHLWEEYSQNREFCGQRIDEGYKLAQKLKEPVFTPSTKSSNGHDEYIKFDEIVATVGEELARKVRDTSFSLYEACCGYALSKGIIIADVKFEFGLDELGNLVLADELFTPDSSRFWSAAGYETGTSPKSYDKQFLRDWLQNNKKDGQMQFNKVPDEVLKKTADIYSQCLQIITSGDQKDMENVF